MARIRTIKPEFWKHEELSALPEIVHMTAAALLNYADDSGYFNANPLLVKAECFPLREPSMSIPEILRSLQDVGYISLGTGDDGRRYGRICNFETHQRISHPTPSKIADKTITWESSGNSPESFRSPPEPLRPERNREQGKEQGNNDQFFEFWKSYPRKVGKGHARKAWVSACRKAKPAVILDGLKSYQFPDDEKFIPHASTWLNGERWADEKITGPPDSDPAWRGVEI